MKIYKSTIQLLRIPFSINLLPIFLFALYCTEENLDLKMTLAVFVLIHFVFYPASNAYNSYMDQDSSSIAGIKDPPPPTKQLFHASILLDTIGLIASLFISLPFFLINFCLMLLSRAYSYKRIRLKKYAIISFFMVALAQGGLSFYNMFLGVQGLSSFPALTITLVRNVLIASLFVAAIYPVTQIYQHDEDRKNGDETMSMLVGIRGTFILSGVLFAISNLLLFSALDTTAFLVFEACMLFSAIFFIYWTTISWRDKKNANYKNTMIMALSASIGMIAGFSVILLANL